MIKKETKDKVLSFRVPYSLYESYEQACIEDQKKMSEILQQAVHKKVRERMHDLKKFHALQHQ